MITVDCNDSDDLYEGESLHIMKLEQLSSDLIRSIDSCQKELQV